MAVDAWKRYVPGRRETQLQAAHQLRLARALGLPIRTRDCDRCEAPFVVHGRQHFCSTECTRGAELERRRRPVRVGACEQCGEPFAAKRRDARFCSDACRVRAFRARSQSMSRALDTASSR